MKKTTEQEIIINEIDHASKELDLVVGRVMHGTMGTEEVTDWLEHDAVQISDVLEKAKDFIEDNEEK
ncbi:hypothetical protein AB4Z50_20230 [Paenibacillus sp. 2TAB26]|uniref:hypothetical protein n=1 Tax=Paenibacillus sp. 2TAB26 TaxID=3233005 RepID=UPI003F96CC98